MQKSDLLKSNKKIPKSLLTLLVYDLLFGKGIGSAGPLKQHMMKYKTRLQAELSRIKIKRKVKSNEDLIPDHIKNSVVLPRYIRVNTLKTTCKKVLDQFQNEGFRLVDYADLNLAADLKYIYIYIYKSNHFEN